MIKEQPINPPEDDNEEDYQWDNSDELRDLKNEDE